MAAARCLSGGSGAVGGAGARLGLLDEALTLLGQLVAESLVDRERVPAQPLVGPKRQRLHSHPAGPGHLHGRHPQLVL